MNFKSFLTAAAVLGLSTGLCHAAVYDFDFTDNGLSAFSINATGTFTTDDAPFASNVISVTGLVNGIGISGLDGSGFNIYLTDTNAASFSFFDANSVSYTLSNGSNGNDTATSSDGQTSQGTLAITPGNVSTVPLPASAPMFGAALLALAGLGYAAKRKKAATAA